MAAALDSHAFSALGGSAVTQEVTDSAGRPSTCLEVGGYTSPIQPGWPPGSNLRCWAVAHLFPFRQPRGLWVTGRRTSVQCHAALSFAASPRALSLYVTRTPHMALASSAPAVAGPAHTVTGKLGPLLAGPHTPRRKGPTSSVCH